MYLLLVDHEFINSADLQEMIESAPEGTDIVNCYSKSTLLKISEKLSPDLVIVDFLMIKEELATVFNELRSKNKNAYVMALIDPDYYEQLFEAIELGGIDDYMVKPIQKEDFMARIKIATRKKKFDRQDTQLQSYPYPVDHEVEEPARKDSEDLEESMTVDQAQDQEAFFAADDEDLFDLDKFEPAGEQEEPEEEIISEDEATPDEITLSGGPGLFEEEMKTDDDLPEPEEEPGRELNLDSHLELELEPKDDPGFASGFDTGPDKVGEFSFDDIVPGEEDDQDEDLFKPDQEGLEESNGEGYGLFDEPTSQEQEEEMLSGESFSSLFDDETPESFEPVEDEQSKSFGETIESEPFGVEDFEEQADQEPEDKQTEPGPEILRPADEFVKDSSEDLSRKEDSFRFTTLSPEEEDKEFEDLFADAPPSPSPESMEWEPVEEESILPEGDDAFTGTPPAEDKVGEGKRRSLSSQLPGKSADDFLFGKDPDEEEGRDQGGQGYNQDMLDQFTGDDDEEEPGPRSRAKRKKSSKSRFPRIFTIIGNIVFVILLLVMAALSFFLIQSRITGGVPEVAGYQMYIVLSGSMQPEFDTGSLAFVRETDPEELTTGDIITFRSPANPESLTTHRIVEVQDDDGLQFVTRGDANNINDPNPVPDENVVGRVTGSVPYVGYLMNFVQTSQGLILLIFVPGVLIIVFELGKIMKYLTQGEEGNKRKGNGRRKYPAEEGE